MKNSNVDLTIPTAVLIIDVQNVMFDENFPVHQSIEILDRIKKIEHFALDKQLLTIYIQHAGEAGSPEEHGTHGWQFHPALSLKGPTLEKKTFDAFESTNLGSLLSENKIKQVIICGMQSDYCINANSRTCAKMGYETILVKDAHSTCDSEELSAGNIITKINSDLENLVKLITTAELIS